MEPNKGNRLMKVCGACGKLVHDKLYYEHLAACTLLDQSGDLFFAKTDEANEFYKDFQTKGEEVRQAEEKFFEALTEVKEITKEVERLKALADQHVKLKEKAPEADQHVGEAPDA